MTKKNFVKGTSNKCMSVIQLPFYLTPVLMNDWRNLRFLFAVSFPFQSLLWSPGLDDDGTNCNFL